MFEKIIWATDGSDAADSALPYAKALAAGGSLLVLHCNEILVGRPGGYSALADEDMIVDKIRKQVADMKREGLDATFELANVPSRHASEVIANVARDTAADLIVVGSHGHSAAAGLILGSVTQQLLHLKSCPVLAIPPRQQAARNEAPALEVAEVVR